MLRLGSAPVTSITDYTTLALTAKVNNLPALRVARDQLAALDPSDAMEKRLAMRAGLGLQAITAHLNRWGTDNLGPSASSKVASTQMRLSGMDAFDTARRRGFQVSMVSAIGSLVERFQSLDAPSNHDAALLRSKGVTDTDWSVWRAATLEDWGHGNGVLTPIPP